MAYVMLVDNVVVMTSTTLNAGFTEIANDDARLTTFNALMSHPPSVSFNVFLNRLTGPEQMAVFTEAQTNPQILAWTSMGAAKGVVDLADPDTATGLDMLVSAGIIDGARKAALLTP